MPATPRDVLDRRRFLAAGGAVAALVVADRLAGAWPVPAQRGGYPFTLGVASGDPAPGGVVLWTRLAPQPLLADGGMPARTVPVDWQVAADPRFRRVMRGGTVLAQPAHAHTVHIEVEGLESARPWVVPVPGRRGAQPGRPDPHPARPRVVARAAGPGRGVLPAL
jgi:alkaline phosphatase D